MARVRIFIERAGVLFRYTVETCDASAHGWRPTHRWALAVARRRARRLTDGHDVDVHAA
ncbi:MAG: hypothetical protein HYX32_08720 [Actinobacteria bacterium]|nr:hypothetical protein [Actinomycetota bacterium]